MTYRFGLLVVALGTALAGCTGSLQEADFDLQDEAGQGTGDGDGGARGVDGGEGGTTASPAHYGSDESGSVEEDTGFGMSDDLPLAAHIPDIKKGQVPPNTWIIVEQVPPTTERAAFGDREWFYVQDPLAEAHTGLRIEVTPGMALPEPDRWQDLVGWVRHDAQGWSLELEQSFNGPRHDGLEARPVDMAALHVSTAVELDDTLVEVSALEDLRVGFWPVPGVVQARDRVSGESVLVDLRPFDLKDLQLMPGTRLRRLTGVVEIGDGRPVVLPRTSDDIVRSD
ncbi:MAG: hypothetical protein AAGF11_03475 [Myxococcota bacterium]